MSCENACYESQVSGCADISIKAGLDASTSYYVILEKIGNRNVYQRQISTDGAGMLVIQKSIFPDGYFAIGYFNLKIRKASDYSLQPLVFNNAPFNCVLLKVVNTNTETDDTSPISSIQ